VPVLTGIKGGLSGIGREQQEKNTLLGPVIHPEPSGHSTWFPPGPQKYSDPRAFFQGEPLWHFAITLRGVTTVVVEMGVSTMGVFYKGSYYGSYNDGSNKSGSGDGGGTTHPCRHYAN